MEVNERMCGWELLPIVRGSIDSTKVREQFPETGNNMARKGRNEGRPRLQAKLHALPGCTAAAVHGAKSTQAHKLPNLGVHPSRGKAQPNRVPGHKNAIKGGG